MNIFFVDTDPKIAAESLHDKHVVKMIVESAQMLSTCHRIMDGAETKAASSTGKTLVKNWILPDKREEILYKVFGANHPCNKWVRKSYDNYIWLYMHYMALLNEYEQRYSKEHKTKGLWLALLYPPFAMREFKFGFTPPPLCMPENYKTEDLVESYRNYYIGEKIANATWKRNKPCWI